MTSSTILGDDLGIFIENHPGDYWALLEYGRHLRRLGLPEESIDVFLRSTELAPGFAIGYYELALSYLEVGDSDQASVMEDFAREVEPGWFALYGEIPE